jgi:putative transcriptional regulator
VKNRLKDLRAERGWSQAELADRLGVSPLAFKIARMFALGIEQIFSAESE